MISISDGKDIHFHKAKFVPKICPSDCKRPCENICPTFLISQYGVSKNKYYGCGRCISSGLLNLSIESEYQLSQESLKDILLKIKPDSSETHTEIHRKDACLKISKKY